MNNFVNAAVAKSESMEPGLSLVYVGPDMGDAATFRRCEVFAAIGVSINSFAFDRRAGTVERKPRWPHVDLGPMAYGVGLGRLRALARALARLIARRRTIAAARLLWARNLDLALLMLAVAGKRQRLAYEVLDIHPMLTRQGHVGRVFRWLERRVLARADLVVVSSPAFVHAYFRHYTPYRGPVFLLENKVCAPLDTFSPDRLAVARAGPGAQAPLAIGLVGRLRCARSLRLLEGLLQRTRRRVEVHVFGYAETTAADAFASLLAQGDRVTWHGRFAYPDDLPDVYRRLSLNWCVVFDEHEPLNGLWLLPNRIYEGGLFAVPAIALVGTETGRWVERVGGGWLLDAAIDDDGGVAALTKLIDGLDATALADKRRHLAAQPVTHFMDGYQDHEAVLRALTAMPGTSDGLAPPLDATDQLSPAAAVAAR